MLNRVSAVLGLIAVIGGHPARANTSSPSASDVVSKTITIDRLVQREMAARGVPGLQLVIVHHGMIAFSGAYGLANIEHAQRVKTHTLFRSIR